MIGLELMVSSASRADDRSGVNGEFCQLHCITVIVLFSMKHKLEDNQSKRRNTFGKGNL
jgi:hypothetical protein